MGLLVPLSRATELVDWPMNSTGAMKRYPRLAIVSTKRELSAESPSAWRSLAIAALRAVIKINEMCQMAQSASFSFSRVTASPACSSKKAQ